MYEILTQDQNEGMIKKILLDHHLDFTMVRAQGAYKNKPEDSLVIQIDDQLHRILPAAKEIRALNGQDAVYIEHIPTTLLAIKESGCQTLNSQESVSISNLENCS